jgi:hypothetical protein
VAHAGQRGQLVQGAAGGGFDEGHRQVLARGLAELHVHHEVDGALLVVAHHHQAAGAGDADTVSSDFNGRRPMWRRIMRFGARASAVQAHAFQPAWR